MSRWVKSGTAVIVREPIPHVTDPDRSTRGYEAIRAKAAFPEPVSSRAEGYDQRQRRLAKRRGDCGKCGAHTGQRCWDLGLLPTRVYALGFHKGRPMLPPPDTTVEPMTRLTPRNAMCKCGHTAGNHRSREAKCAECRCRKLKETP